MNLEEEPKPKRKFPEPVEALIVILILFVPLYLAAVLVNFLASPGGNPLALQEASRYFYILGGLLFGIIPYLYAVWRKYDIKRLFRFNRVPWEIILLSFILAIALSIIGDELDRLVDLFVPIPDWLYESMRPLKAQTGFDWILIITGAVFVAAAAEEALFRGFLQVTLERKGDVTRAVILSSLTWTLVHGNFYWAVEIFIIGIFIGFLAWRTQSLIPSFVVHATNNLIAVIFLNIDTKQSMAWYEWGDHVSPLILIIALVLIIWTLQQITRFYRRSS